ncbi:MAG: MoxR family ATPase [Eggerthellaceae bacterium]|nr:MoxR family ATPase [Eggerthellaceae bacterium]
MNQQIASIVAEVTKAIKGKDDVVRKVTMAVLAQGNVLLEDVPGVGKTTMALAFAKAMGLATRRVQFTPDTMPSDIIGFSVYDSATGNFVYREGAIMTNLFLADEINRTSSKTQAALLEAMEEKRVTVDGTTYTLPDPFIVLATENPVGAAGTQMLPNSQLDRFMVRLSIGYPDYDAHMEILESHQASNPMDSVAEAVSLDELRSLVDQVGKVEVSRGVNDYIVRLVQSTHAHQMVSLGINPRGALALARMAKACAFAEGRDYVVPSDVRCVISDVFSHRLLLNSKAKLNDLEASDVVAQIVEDVAMPLDVDVHGMQAAQ